MALSSNKILVEYIKYKYSKAKIARRPLKLFAEQDY